MHTSLNEVFDCCVGKPDVFDGGQYCTHNGGTVNLHLRVELQYRRSVYNEIYHELIEIFFHLPHGAVRKLEMDACSIDTKNDGLQEEPGH